MLKDGQTPFTNNLNKSEIHLRDYFTVIKKRRTTIITFLILTVLFVTIASFSMIPLYTASSQILIEENLGESGLENSYSYRRYDPQFLDTQFKIIKSDNVVKRVVQQLQLDTKYRHYFLKEEKSKFVFLRKIKERFSKFLQSFSSPAETQSPEAGSDKDSLTKVEPVSDTELIVKNIQENLTITPERDTKIVNIIFNHRVPGMAQLITDFLIDAYKIELQEIKHSSSNDTLKWMSEKAEQERKKLEDSELALQTYMKKNDIITVENKLAIYPQKLSEFSSQLSIVQAERKKLESTYLQIQKAREDSKDLETIPVFAGST